MYHGTPEGDQAEITIWSDDGPDRRRSSTTRESGRIDEDPDSAERFLPSPRRREVRSRLPLNSETGDWPEEWDSTRNELNKLPRAVQILLVLQGPDPDDEDEKVDHTYLTTVLLDMADPINKDTTNTGATGTSGHADPAARRPAAPPTGGTPTGGTAAVTGVWRELTVDAADAVAAAAAWRSSWSSPCSWS
jgi:hypothetical protein